MPANNDESLWAAPIQEAADLFTGSVKLALQPSRMLLALLDLPADGEQISAVSYDASQLPLLRMLQGAGRPRLLSASGDQSSMDAEAVQGLVSAGWLLAAPLQTAERLIGWLLLAQKQTGEVYTEDDLQLLGALCGLGVAAFEHARLTTSAQADAENGKELITYVSHELKNPITAIKGYAEMLAGGKVGPLTERQAGFLITIRDNAERMMVLVSDLSEVSRLEAGKLRLDLQPVSLYEVVNEAVRSIQGQVMDKGQNLQVTLEEDLPRVLADRNRLAQIITNLLSNAYKYTPAGGQIVIGAERITLETGVHVHVLVRDNGLGIRAEDQPFIFQKFFRSDDPEAHAVGGSGLGLNISRRLVEMQGGKIWLESEYRNGTTFHVTLAAAPGEPEK